MNTYAEQSHNHGRLKRLSILVILMVSAVVASSCRKATATDNTRQRETFDFDWKFHLGDLPEAKEASFNDSEWRALNLPHDWSIEGEYDENNPTTWRGGFLPAGVGWYRKSFTMDPADREKRVFLEFDGIYMNSDVYINGHHLGHRPNGYISFHYEITDHIITDGPNVIAVRVDNSKVPSGRWYTGCGIYRHSWLTTVNPVHVAHQGTYVRTENVSESNARVLIDLEVENQSAETAELSVSHAVVDKNNREVGSVTLEAILKAHSKESHSTAIQLSNPELWSPDHPYLYKVVTELSQAGKILDTYETPLGIRYLEFGPEFGMKLNGERIKVKGVCNHHDAGPVGAAIPEDVLRRRLNILKDMGCNAIRTAHNPLAPEFYALCDELGLLVMDELLDGWEQEKADFDYGLYFEDWWEQDMTDWLKRDRNHPSVFMWSIGNEVKGVTLNTQKKLVDLCHLLDPTRPVTQGGHNPRQTDEMSSMNGAGWLDIKGFNGIAEEVGTLEKFQEQFPKAVAIGTELPHSYQTRGVYRSQTWWRRRDFQAPWEIGADWDSYEPRVFPIEDLATREVFPEETEKNYLSSYDNASVRISVRQSWQRTSSFDFLIGEFRWGGFDYLGESNFWPTRFHSFGVIDLCGFPKDHFYLLQSLWSEKPMVHILPHWTHPGKEGTEIPVVAYTNCDEVELILNGDSLGRKTYEGEQLVWMVPYQAGSLQAIAYNDGKKLGEDAYQTAGEAHGIRLKGDRTAVTANNRDIIHLEVDIVDSRGTLVPKAGNLVEFKISGPARLLGVENGDPLDHAPHKVPYRKTFRGKCLLILQSTGEPGTIEVIAESESLQAEKITVSSTKG